MQIIEKINRLCISKINNTFIDNAEDLNTVMPMYNLLEYRNNCFMTSVSLRNYYRDKVNNNANENNADNYGIHNKKMITSKYFEHST